MKTIDQAGDLKGKHVLMRADFDVPVRQARLPDRQAQGKPIRQQAQGKPIRQACLSGRQAQDRQISEQNDGVQIEDAFRIEKQREMVGWLLGQGARVVLIAHISAVPSFAMLQRQFQEVLGVDFTFLQSPDELEGFWAGDGRLALLENLRMWPGEKAGDENFARSIAHGADLFVNNAFAACHRPHASMVEVARILPAYAGMLVAQEVQQLQHVLTAPTQGKVVFMGGAKVETKMPVIKNLLSRAESIAVGGKIANELDESLRGRVRMPTDFVLEAGTALDIGPETARHFAALAASAKLIVWNGPMGKFEDVRFQNGTRVLAEAIARAEGFTLIGGGDTIAAVAAFDIARDQFNHICTGGGAMLTFLAGEPLPGLVALGYDVSA